MTTLADIADRCQDALADAAAGTWSQNLVEDWVVEAIRSYSNSFPQLGLQQSITTTADTRKYDLEVDFTQVISVEYPVGEDPPEYLIRRDYLHPNFWTEAGYFDIVNNMATYDADVRMEIWISEKPAADEYIKVHYYANHTLPTASGDKVTVPDEHQHLLVQFVVWQAWRALTSAEMQDPTSNSSLLMAQMNQNMRDARRDYYRQLDILRSQMAEGGIAGVWTDADRIY